MHKIYKFNNLSFDSLAIAFLNILMRYTLKNYFDEEERNFYEK